MTVYFDRVRFYTPTSGAGATIAVGLAFDASFLTPAEAGVVNGDTPDYVIRDGLNMEVGQAVFGAGATSFTRTVTRSKIAGVVGTTPITLSGNAEVFLTDTARLLEVIRANDIAAAAHIASTANPHAVTKTQVGLGNVDNTSDVNKPVSTAQAAADALKVSKAGDTMSGFLTLHADPDTAMKAATKQYVDQIIAAQDAMVFKGVIDCSANPNYPAADRGHTYRVSVAGKIGGASGPNVEAGDLLLCLTDGSASGNQATVGANWTISQANIDGAVVGPASAVDNRFVTFSGPTGKLVADDGQFVGSGTDILTGTSTGAMATADAIAALWEAASVTAAADMSLPEGGYFVVNAGAATVNSITFATNKSGRRCILYNNVGGNLTLKHLVGTGGGGTGTGIMILPGGVDLVLGISDIVEFVCSSTQYMICTNVFRASGAPPLVATPTDVLTGTDNIKPATSDAIAALWEKGGSSITTAATITLGEGGWFILNGAGTVTDIDFSPAKDGRRAWVLVNTAGIVLTHSSTLRLPGAANITTQALDRFLVGQWNADEVYVLDYERADGSPLALGAMAASGVEVNQGVNAAKIVTPDALAAMWETGGGVTTPASGDVTLGEGGYFIVTGAGQIDGLALANFKSGRRVVLYFNTGGIILKHLSTGSSADMALPGNADIVTQAGDQAEFLFSSAAYVPCINYNRLAGQPINKITFVPMITAGSGNIAWEEGASHVDVEMKAGGGGGGGAGLNAGGGAAGAGGGEGELRKATFTRAQWGTTQPYTIGAGGAGGVAATGATGSAGGDTTLGTSGALATAKGGSGGEGSGTANASAGNQTQGGAGGVNGTGSGTTGLPGAPGGNGVSVNGSCRGGGLGGGNGGARPTQSNVNTNGTAGGAGLRGGGGSGAIATTTTAFIGGAGGPGYIFLRWYYG